MVATRDTFYSSKSNYACWVWLSWKVHSVNKKEIFLDNPANTGMKSKFILLILMKCRVPCYCDGHHLV